MPTKTWNGSAADNDVNNPDNWSGGLPVDGDDVIITDDSISTPAVGSFSAEWSSLRLSIACSAGILDGVTIAPGGSLTILDSAASPGSAFFRGSASTLAALMSNLGSPANPFGNQNGPDTSSWIITQSLTIGGLGDFLGDARAVNGAAIHGNLGSGGIVGDYASFSPDDDNPNPINNGVAGDHCSFDGTPLFGSPYAQNLGILGDYAAFRNSANNAGTIGDFATFDGADGSGLTGNGPAPGGAGFAGSCGIAAMFRNGAFNFPGGSSGESAAFGGDSANQAQCGDHSVFADSAQNGDGLGDGRDGSTGNYSVFGDSAENFPGASTGDFPVFEGNATNGGSAGQGASFADFAANSGGAAGASAIFSGNSAMNGGSLDGVAAFNDDSAIGAGQFGDTLSWNSEGEFSSSLGEIDLPARIDVYAPLTIACSANVVSSAGTSFRLMSLTSTIDLANLAGWTLSGDITMEIPMSIADISAAVAAAILQNTGNKLFTDASGAIKLPDPAPSGYGGPAAPGADRCTLAIAASDGSPVVGAKVWITDDADGAHVIAGTAITDAHGRAEFLLTAGDVYYLWMESTEYNPILGQAFTAVADG